MKKRLFIRLSALMLAIALLMGMSGCTAIEELKDLIRQGLMENMPKPTEEPAPTVRPGGIPVPTPTPTVFGEEASALLRDVDLALFKLDMENDPLTLKLTLKNPEALGIGMPEATWGELSYEENMRNTEKYCAYLDVLSTIDRSALSRAEQITYDTICQELNAAKEAAGYYYYDEILSPYNGLQTNLPFNFVFYTLDNEQDVENYLCLLEDAARLMAEDVLRFEQEKAERGLFMTDATLDDVLEQIRDFATAGEDCFLFGLFEENVSALGLENEDAYIARNKAAVEGLFAAYNTLYDGLEALRGSCTGTGALWEYEQGEAYFILGLNDAACTITTPEEAFNILEDQLMAEVSKLYQAIMHNPNIDDMYGTVDLTVGSSEDNLALLEELMADFYPELPAHGVRFIDVPKELEDQFSPAAYLVPPIDDASENTIIINQKTMADDPDLLSTIAHEGYPGHMYHYIYLRGTREETGWYRQNMNLTGYYESWSQYAENFFAEFNDTFDNDYCMLMAADARIGNLLLPAVVSIGVNYLKWDEGAVADYLATYYSKEGAEQLAPIYYKISIDDPFYYIEYAMGYSMLQQELADAQQELGAKFDYKAFNEAVLTIGPTYFNLLAPRLDEWVASMYDHA